MRSKHVVQLLVGKVHMQQCKVGPCIFQLRMDRNVELILYVHVDGVIATGEDEACGSLLFVALEEEFQTT